jgi:hypothetical protein
MNGQTSEQYVQLKNGEKAKDKNGGREIETALRVSTHNHNGKLT